MAVAVCVLAVQANALQQSDDLIVAVLFILSQMMDINALTHDVANGHAGVQTCVGILKNDLHPTAVGQHIHCDLVILIKQQVAVIVDLAAGGLVQAQQGAAGSGLATTGLIYQTKGLTLADGKAYVIHSLNVLAVLAHTAGGEILLQVLDFDQRLVFTHSAFSPFSNAAFCCSQQ